ncbi:MAG: hypothetical protein K9G76_10925 [Bacteroidales bacterium]|nr:hypothetical protein [Bacteroidales bacterium]MCF8404905.1 hypothetical protein [Bacteroidales bacterium]
MKKLVLSLLLVSAAFIVKAQNWTDNLDKQKLQNNELKFNDYQKAFYDYWEPFDVKNGYYEVNGEAIKAPGWKQFKRWEWLAETRIDGDGNFPSTSTVEQMDIYYKNYPDAGKSISGNWTNIGYNATNGGYQGIGRVNCIAFHPSNTNTFWLGAPSGGLWKSADGGVNWTVLTDNNSELGISAIAVTSNYTTSNTIYIGTGDRDGGSAWSLGGGNTHDNEGVGVLKSTDGGATWTSSLSFTPSQKIVVYDLLINPTNDNNLIAATGNGIYETTNAGSSWTQITTNVCTDLEYRPGSTTVFYGAFINGKYILTFTKSGTWSWSTYTLVGSASSRTELAVSANNSSYVYALTVNGGGGLEAIYRSTNSGVSYTKVIDGSVAGNNLLGYNCTPSTTTGQGTYDVFITANPSNANDVYVGGINVWRIDFSGSSPYTPTIKSHWSTTCGGNVNIVHADQHCCEFQPGTSNIFLGNDGGIYKSTDYGSNWTDLSNTLTINQIYRIGQAAQSANDIIIGLQDNGTHFYSAGSWVMDGVLGGDGMECLIDPSDINTQYGEYPNGAIRRTTNQWASNSDITTGLTGSGTWVTPFILDPNNSNTIYVGYQDVFKSTDQGNSWTKLTTWAGSTIRSIAVAPSNSSYIYAATLTAIFKTTNGGTLWSDITSGLPVSNGNITYVTVKNNDPNTVWVTIGGFNTDAVYQTTNGGTTWTNISSGLPQLPAMSIVQNKLNSSKDELYVAMTQGVWVKYGAANWIAFKTGLPNVMCTEMDIYYDSNTPSNSRLRVGTFGRGLWESSLPLVDFTANNTMPSNSMTTVGFTDLSTNSPIGWSWSFSPATVTFVGGTNSFSQNPLVVFNNPGAYTVTLSTSNAFGVDSHVKSAYIHMGTPGLWTGTTDGSWSTGTNWHNHLVPTSITGVTINPGSMNWPVYTGNFNVGTDCGTLLLNGNAEFNVLGNFTIPAGKMVSCNSNVKLKVAGDFINYGTFTPGNSVVLMDGNTNASISGNQTNTSSQATTAFVGSGWVYPGAYFDVVASGGKSVTINSCDFHCNTTGTVNVEVWYKSGSYIGFTSSSGAWTQLGTTQTITGQGAWTPTIINPGASITIPSGSTYGFYINCYSGSNGYMWFTGGSNSYGNADLTINTGDMASNVIPGNGSWNGYTFNGTVYYSYVTSNPLSFYDLDINKTNATVTTDGILTVNNDLTVAPGAFFTNASGNSINVLGNMTLEGDATGKASFIDKGSFSVSGGSTMQSYYTDGRWHFISSPMANALSSTFLGIYLKEWDEANYVWNYVTSTTQALTPGKGFEIWSTIGNPIVNYSGGALNVGDISPTLTATDINGGGIGTNEGWNLVGNPYPSAIDWGTINNPVLGYVRTNLDNSIYIWTGTQYATYNPSLLGGAGLGTNGGSQYIQSMQSFFIKANNTSPVLTIPNAARVHSSSPNLKTKSEVQYISLKADGNGDSDEMIIEVNENSSFNFDSEYDAYKLYGIEESPQIYIITAMNELSVDVIPEININTIIPVGFKAGVANSYSITAAQIENFDEFEMVLLEDLLTGYAVNLKEDPVYSFEASPSDDPERFRLRFTDEITGLGTYIMDQVQIYAYANFIYVNIPDDQTDYNLTVYSILGQKVGYFNLEKQTLNKIEISHGTGFYLAEVKSPGMVTTRKVLIR